MLGPPHSKAATHATSGVAAPPCPPAMHAILVQSTESVALPDTARQYSGGTASPAAVRRFGQSAAYTTIRTAALAALVAGALGATRLPQRALGGVALAIGAGRTFGAFAGQIVPLVRTGRVPPASAPASLDLGGGVLMLVVGIVLLRHPSGKRPRP